MKSLFSVVVVLLIMTGSPAMANKGNSCWGEASAIFARLGEMGVHSSNQAEPRMGLANLARYLFDAGVLPEPTLAALADFVASALGLELTHCLENESAIAVAEHAVAVNAACWGQASMVFARMGLMGQHSSQQSNPRAGLRNLARLLADAGVLADDSMASLGAFVAAELGLQIDACD